MKLKDKNIIIVGASSGIGEALAHKLDADNHLALFSRREIDISKYKNAIYHQGDTTNFEDVKQALNIFSKKLGSIDGLFYMAGISEQVFFPDVSSKSAIELMNVNYFGFLYWLELVLPVFHQRNDGLIAVTTGLNVSRSLPEGGTYCASKAALHILIECLKMDMLKSGIQFCEIQPGLVDTPMSRKYDFKNMKMLSPHKATEYIVDGIENNKSTISFPKHLGISMKVLNQVPDQVYFWVLNWAKNKKS